MQSFIAEVANVLRAVTYGPMEYVFDEDEPVDRMYCIVKGRVQMEDWAGDQLHAQVGRAAQYQVAVGMSQRSAPLAVCRTSVCQNHAAVWACARLHSLSP